MINEEVSKKQADCERDLAKAEPALLAAQAALDTLNKNNLTELKSFGSPPAAVVNVTAAVMVLLSNKAGRSFDDLEMFDDKFDRKSPLNFNLIAQRICSIFRA